MERPKWVFSTTTNPRVMNLGTHTQVPDTNTPAKFQGHSLTITPLPLTCVVFKVIEPKM